VLNNIFYVNLYIFFSFT